MVNYLPLRKILRDVRKRMRNLPPEGIVDISTLNNDVATRFLIVNLDQAVTAAIQEVTGVEVVGELAEDQKVVYETDEVMSLIANPDNRYSHPAENRALWRAKKPHHSDTILVQMPYEIGRQDTIDFVKVRGEVWRVDRIHPRFETVVDDGKGNLYAESDARQELVDMYNRTFDNIRELVDRSLF